MAERKDTAPAREGPAPVREHEHPVPGTHGRPAAPSAPDAGAQPRAGRRGIGWRTRNLGAATIGAVGSGVMALASLVILAAVAVALLVALAILCVDLDANASNTIVKGIHEGANFFAGSFSGLIRFSGHPKRAVTVDWGIALAVYLLAGFVLSRWIARLGRGGLRFERAHRAAV